MSSAVQEDLLPVPKYDSLFNPTLQAIKRLGGSASIAELEEEVIRSLGLTDEEIAEPHDERRTKLEYRLAWARTYLKAFAFGLLDNSEHGVWVLTAKGKEVDTVDPRKVKRFVADQRKGKQPNRVEGPTELIEAIDSPEVAEAVLEQTWREELLAALLNLRPEAFERLCQRLLREADSVCTYERKPSRCGVDPI
jgi:restriction system protein